MANSIDASAASAQLVTNDNVAKPLAGPTSPQESTEKQKLKPIQESATELTVAKDKALETKATKVEKEQQKEKPDAIQRSMELIQRFVDTNQRGINFSLHEEPTRTIIKVIDVKSQEVIKQFPSEELLKIAEKIEALDKEFSEKIGIFFDSSV